MSTPTPQTPQTPDQPDTPDTPDLPVTRQTSGATDDRHRADGDSDTGQALADEVFVDGGHTRPLPSSPAGTATATVPAPPRAPAPASAPAPVPVPEPTGIKGPAPFALVLGVLGLLVAGGVLLNELVDLTLPWNDLGPWSVVAAGVVVLLVGAIGLRTSRTDRD